MYNQRDMLIPPMSHLCTLIQIARPKNVHKTCVCLFVTDAICFFAPTGSCGCGTECVEPHVCA